MNLTQTETSLFFSELFAKSHLFQTVEMHLLQKRVLRAGVIPPFLSLAQASHATQNSPFPLDVLAQNAHWETEGAFTGEVSGPMLQDLNIQQVLIGHSERRQYFGETDETAAQRAISLLNQGLSVLFCVGENQQARKAGKTLSVLRSQLDPLLKKIELKMKTAPVLTGPIPAYLEDQIRFAYEPVWAIGTGVTPTSQQAEEGLAEIRQQIRDTWGDALARKIPLLYGGSVNAQNVKTFLACPNGDGVLVGGGSLKPDSFIQLLKAGAEVLIQNLPEP